MANQLFDVQLSIPAAERSPFVSGDKRLTSLNLAQLVRSLAAGTTPGLAGSGAYLQYQTSAVCASGTATCAAVEEDDAITLADTAITAKQGRAAGTAECDGVTEGDTLTINGVTFTAVDGEVTPGEATFDCSGTDAQAAASIVSQFDAYVAASTNPLLAGLVGVKSAAAVVTIYALAIGTSGNAITLAQVGDNITLSGDVLEGGAALANNTFDYIATNALTAESLADAINNSSTAAVKQCTASAASGVVTISSKVAGLAGNTLTLTTSNNTRLAVSGATLADGAASAVTRFYF